MLENLVRRHASRIAWCLVGLGLAIRLQGIGAWWLNPDEGIHFVVATARDWQEFLRELGWNAHPPIFFAALRGLAMASQELAILRLLPVAAGALAIHGLYRLGREAGGAGLGVGVAALATLAPGLVAQSQVLRPYSLLVALLAYAAAFALAHLRDGRGRDLAGYAVGITLALWTHYGAVLLAAPIGVVLAANAVLRRRSGRALAEVGLAHLPLAATGAFLLLGHASDQLGGQFWLAPFHRDDLAGAWLGLAGVHRFLFGLRFESLAVALFLAGLALWTLRRAYAPLGIVVGSIAIAWALSAAALYPFGCTRHSVVLAPAVLLPIGAALAAAASAGLRGGLLLAATVALGLAFPDALRRPLDRRPPQLPAAERVLRTQTMRELEPLFEQVRTNPGVLVMDRETLFVLVPILPRSARPDASRPPGTPHRFAWGETTVLVSGRWNLRTGPERVEETDHLRAFLHASARAAPDLALAERDDVWVFFAGWGVGGASRLGRLHQQLREARPFVSAQGAVPGFAWVQLDSGRYLAALAPPPS